MKEERYEQTDGFNILINAQIDEALSKNKIIGQLKKMQEGLAVNITMQIDPELQKSIQGFSKQMERVNDATLKQLQNTKEIVTINKELDGTIQKISQKYVNEVKVNEEIITTVDKKKQKTRELLDLKDKEADADKRRIKDLDEIGKKLKEITLYDANNNVVGKQRDYRQAGTTNGVVSVKTDNEGYVSSVKVIDNIKQEEDATKKLTKAKEALRKQLQELQQVGRISAESLKSVGNAINATKSQEGITKLTERMKELQRVSKETVDNEAQQFQNNKREQEKNDLIAHRIKLYQQEMAVKLQDSQTRYGSAMSSNDAKALEDIRAKMLALNAATPNATREMQRLNAELKQIQANARSNGLTQAGKDAQTFGDMLNNTKIKFPALIMVSREALDGIKYVIDLNKALTEISIVTGWNQKQVDALGFEYRELAREMSVTTKEIALASVEFYRQGLDQAEVMERMATTTQYAKISALSFNDSAKILTATVNSMGIDIERASDVFAYLGDATATGADEIGRAFQRVGGSTAAVGIEFEKMASWIALVSSRTREGAETIGNAFKSITARIQTLREGNLDEEGMDINQVARALDSVGIALTDAQGQFRDFGNVMDELGGKWSSLDSRQRAYLSTTVAGTYQQSRFSNLMEGYAESVKLYEKSLDAAGTTQQKFFLYQQGTEAAVDRLKTAYTGLWQNAFDSQGIRDAINLLTKFIEAISLVIDNVGIVPVALGAFGVALSLLSANFRNAALSMVGLGTAAQATTQVVRTSSIGMNGAINTTTATIETATVATRGLGVAWKALLASTGIGIALVGLSFIVEKLVTHFMSASRASQEFTEQLKANYVETNNSIEKLEELNSKYVELERISDGSTESQDNLKQIRKEINDLMPDSIKYYDAEGNAVHATSKEVGELVKEYKRLNVERARAIADTMIDNTKDDAKELTKLYKNRANLQEEYNKKMKEQEATSFVKNFVENELEGIDQFSDEYTQKWEKLHKDVQEILGWEFNEVAWTANLVVNGNFTKSIEEAKAATANAKLAIDANIADIDKRLQNFVEGFRQRNVELLDTQGETNKNVKVFLDSYAKDFTTNYEITEKNHSDMLELYREHAESILKLQEEGKIDLTKLYDLSNLENVKQQLSSIKIPIQTVDRLITELKNKQESIKKPTIDFSEMMRGLTKSFKETSDEVAPLNELLGELADGKRISSNEALNLIEKEEGLIDAIKFENGILTINKEAVEDLRDAKVKSFEESMKLREEDIKQQGQLLIQELTNYGLQIEGIKSVAEARDALVAKQKETDEKMLKAMEEGRVGLTSIQIWAEQKKKAEETVADLGKIDEAYQRIQKYKSLVESGGLSTPSSKKNSSSSEESKAEALALQDVTNELIKSFNKEYEITKQKEKNIELAIKNADKQKDYNKAINLTNDLLDLQNKKMEQLREANKKINNEANDTRKRNTLGLSNTQMASWFDVNGEATLTYREYINSFVKESEAIVANGELSEKVKKKKVSALQDQQKAAEKLFNAIYALKKAYMANVTDLQSIDGIIEKLNNDIDSFQADIDKIRDDTEKAAQKAHDTWVNKTKKAVSEVQNAIKNYYNNAKDVAIDSIDKQIEAEEKRHKLFIENKDKELNKYRDTIDAILKLNDRDNQEEDYQANVIEQTNSINVLKARRAQLALIDTPEAKAQREELDKQIQESEKNLNKFKLDRQRETTKQGLEDLKEAKEKEIETVKGAEQKQFEVEKERLDKLKKETQDFWKAKIEDDRFFLQIEQDIFNGNVQFVKDKIKEMNINVTSNMKSLGDGIRQNLINTLEDALTLLDQVKYGSSSVYGNITGQDYLDQLAKDRGKPTYNLATGNKEEFTGYQANLMKASADPQFAYSEILRSFGVYAQKGQTWDKQKGALDWATQMLSFVNPATISEMKAQYDGATLLNKITAKESGWEQLAKDELKRAALVYFVKTAMGDSKGATDAHVWADKIRQVSGIQSFDTGGYTGEFQGSKLTLLHQKEYILNQKNFETVLSSIDAANKLIGSLVKPDFRNTTGVSDRENFISIPYLMHIDRIKNASEINVKSLVQQGMDELLHVLGGYGISLN